MESSKTERLLAGKTGVGPLAQLGERLLCKQEVSGSIPLGSNEFHPATDFDLSKIMRILSKHRLP